MPTQQELLDKEYVKQSAFSPDQSHGELVVSNHEKLGRCVIHPDHVENNQLKNNFIPTDDLDPSKNRGLSAERLSYSCRERFDAVIDGYRSRNPKRSANGAAVINTSKVREQNIDGNQASVIYDDANDESEPGHSLIFASSESLSKSKLKEIRSHLIDNMTLENLEQLFQD